MVASFHDLAKVELNEAAQYYDRDSPGLGAAFVTEVERSTAALLEHPEAGPIVQAQFADGCFDAFHTGCSIASGQSRCGFSRS